MQTLGVIKVPKLLAKEDWLIPNYSLYSRRNYNNNSLTTKKFFFKLNAFLDWFCNRSTSPKYYCSIPIAILINQNKHIKIHKWK